MVYLTHGAPGRTKFATVCQTCKSQHCIEHAWCTLLQGTTLTTAWVGDSRGVLAREGKKGLEAVDLTYDHKPTNAEEKARILRSNGRVER